MKKNKVAIYIPPIIPDAPKRTGFIEVSEVKKIEEMLSNNPEVEFLGNINFPAMEIRDDGFFCDGANLKEADLFFWYAPGMKKNLEGLKDLSRVIKVSKTPESFINVADKYLSHTILKDAGLPVVEFALINTNDLSTMERVIKEWKTILIKPRLGSYGRGIIKINDFETLRDIAGLLRAQHKQETIFVEKFYKNKLSEWISTTLVGGKIVYGYRKEESKFAGWKVYDAEAKGGSAYYVDPAPVKDIAENAAQILDQSIVGFDFIKTKEGYKIVDENNFPGFYPDAFKKAGKKISTLIVDLILSRLS